MKIYTIIVTYNAMHRQWIDRCMESLQKSTIPVKAIIIDNGSTDGTRQHIPERYPDAIWLPQEKNLGFGQANNIGIRYAIENDADYVLLLNQDASLDSDAIAQMVNIGREDTLLSPMQLNGDGSKLDAVFKMKLLLTSTSLFDDILTGKDLEPLYVGGDYSAACWMIPSKILKSIGGFNPIFFHYGEDDNYIQRINYHHYKVALVPKARMYHDREIHGSQKMYNKNALRRDMLQAVCNINHSVPKAFVKWLRLLFYYYTHELPKRNYVPGTFLVQLFWFSAHAASICKSRRAEKEQHPNWL